MKKLLGKITFIAAVIFLLVFLYAASTGHITVGALSPWN